MVLDERPFPGAGDPSRLLPLSADLAPFLDGLRERRLVLRRCEDCTRFRHPPGPVCPHCGSASHAPAEVSGYGTIHSWIRYHRSYLPEFDPLMPYVIALVALEEGVRIFGRLGDGAEDPYIGMPVRAIVERCASGICLPAFVPGSGPS
jgi:uncharacterized OB-fold protein